MPAAFAPHPPDFHAAITPAIVNKFVKRIKHSPDKASGHRTQQIDIVYNFVGLISVSLAKKKAA